MFSVEPSAAPVDAPARRLALDALPQGGAVLDVGCGGGAASLALLPVVGPVTGIDERSEALADFAAACEERGLAHAEVLGSWPAVAPEVPLADVVVCHHVLYNSQDPAAFVAALTEHARVRVVMVLNAAHPLTYLRPLWRRFWDLDRPSGPAAADAVAIVRDLGLEPVVALDHRPPGHWRSPEQQVHMARKRLCLPADRDGDVAAALAELPPAPDEIWVLSWAGAG